jgi:hypothetical protein
VTASYPLERAPEAFAQYEREGESILRLVIGPGH